MDSPEAYTNLHRRYTATDHSYGKGNVEVIAKTFGYSAEDLTTVPKNANMGLNPLVALTLLLFPPFNRYT